MKSLMCSNTATKSRFHKDYLRIRNINICVYRSDRTFENVLESELLELITFIRVNRRRHMPLSDVKREFVLPLLATTAI